jgi:hypothetical protein
MNEGQHPSIGAAPRPLLQITRELRSAEEDGDEAKVSRLRTELRHAADAAGSTEVAHRAG